MKGRVKVSSKATVVRRYIEKADVEIRVTVSNLDGAAAHREVVRKGAAVGRVDQEALITA